MINIEIVLIMLIYFCMKKDEIINGWEKKNLIKIDVVFFFICMDSKFF